MADHNKPALTDLYTDWPTLLDGRLDDLARALDPATSTPTNVPTNAVRWNSALNRWQKYNGSTWSDLSTGYDIPLVGGTVDNSPVGADTQSTGAFTTLSASDVTDVTVNSSSTALTVVQSGAGKALSVGNTTRVEVDNGGNAIVGGNIYAGGIFGRDTSTSIGIRPSTSDGTDNQFVTVSGGGASANESRGAYVVVYGNDHGNTGDLRLSSGTGGSVRVRAAGTDALVVNPSGDVSVAGKVGVGTSSPNNRLDVEGGTVQLSRATVNAVAPAGELSLHSAVLTNSVGTPQLTFCSDRIDRYASIGHYRGANSNALGLSFFTDDGAGAQVEQFRLESGGSSLFQANNTTSALTITQTGTGNALVINDQAGETTPLVINGNGVLIKGYGTSQSFSLPNWAGASQYAPHVQILGSSYDSAWQTICNYNTNTTSSSGSGITLAKSQSGAIGTFGKITSANVPFGTISGAGDDGSRFLTGAEISFRTDGVPDNMSMPGKIVMRTTAAGSSVPTDRVVIDSAGQVSVTANNATSALTITQSSTGDALVVNDQTGDTTAFKIDGDGNLTLYNSLQANTYSDNAYAVGHKWSKARGTPSAPTAVLPSDDLSYFRFLGYDGYGFIDAASIITEVDGTPGQNSMPGRITLSTTPAGSTTPVEALRVASTGQVSIGGSAGSGTSLTNRKNITGAVTAAAYSCTGAVQADVTGSAYGYRSSPTTAAAAFTCDNIFHFSAAPGTFGAGSVITYQYGFVAGTSVTVATNNYGVWSNIAANAAGGTTSSSVASVSSSGTTVTVTTTAAHGLISTQFATVTLTANATALINGVVCTILTAGTTDFTAYGAAANTVGTSFTVINAATAGTITGTGTVTLNQQNSGRQVTVVDSTTFTYTSGLSATFSAITAAGTVTPNTRWNIYSAGSAPNYFAGNVILNAALIQTPTYVVPTNAGSTTLTTSSNHLLLNHSATIASYTITFPSVNLVNGQTITVCSRSAITELTVSGGTFYPAAPTTVAAGDRFTYIYSSGASAWFRKD